MITMQRLNVVRKVATEEAAAKLTGAGFARVGGQAETMSGISSELAKFGEALLEKMRQDAAAAAEGQAPAPPPPDGKAKKGAKNAPPIEGSKEVTPNGNGTGEPDQGGCQK